MGTGAVHILSSPNSQYHRPPRGLLPSPSAPRKHGGSSTVSTSPFMLPFDPFSLSSSAAAMKLAGAPLFGKKYGRTNITTAHEKRQPNLVVTAASSSSSWVPDKAANNSPSLISDILWPSAGAFAAMALLGKIDQMLAPRGITMTIAPLGAVCAVLFLTPSAPAAKKYNMFMAQIGCAAIGVVTYSLLGTGWVARSVSLALCIAFMALTDCTHPPAAGLPLLYIDGAKFHHLNYWFAMFPAAAACIILSLLQEIVCYLKENVKF